MPNIRCTECGEQIYIDPYTCPYEGQIACANCRTQMQVSMPRDSSVGVTKVEPKYPFDPLEDFKKEWAYLTDVERNSFNEAAIDIGNKAYTSAEFMAMRALESVSRRLYKKTTGKEAPLGWGRLIDELANTELFQRYAGVVEYFKDVRNRLAHPEGISTELDAKSSYMMAVRLVKELPLEEIYPQ